jgi:hypothetical protein
MLKNRKYILLIFSSLMMLFLFNFETISTSITRSIHKENLKKSRSSKTYGISRTERKNLQLPPNQYNEQIRMLSMDPIKGRVLTKELYKLQDKLRAARNSEQLINTVPGQSVASKWTEQPSNKRTNLIRSNISKLIEYGLVGTGLREQNQDRIWITEKGLNQ